MDYVFSLCSSLNYCCWLAELELKFSKTQTNTYSPKARDSQKLIRKSKFIEFWWVCKKPKKIKIKIL